MANYGPSRAVTPFDKTRKEHIAEVARVIFPRVDDADNPFVIIACDDESKVRGPAMRSDFEAGIKYRFLGRWEESDRGPIFTFATYVRDTPHNKLGVIKYLRDEAPNVGSATANNLWGRYQSDAVRVLRETPQQVADDGIMSFGNAVEASLALKKISAMESTKVDLFTLFAGTGLNGKAIDAAIRAWGAKAPKVIARNPFCLLLKKIPGAGFKRCDKMFLELGRPAKSLKRQTLLLWNYLRNLDGSTWATVESCAEALASGIPDCDAVKAIRFGKRIGYIATRRDESGKLWLAEGRRAANEAAIALHITRLKNADAPLFWRDALPVSQVEGDGLLSVHQAEQGLAATRGKVGVLIGSPGTGKTHTLAFILKEAIQAIGRDRIAVCAPTGKAAIRATFSLKKQGINIRARTVHSLLGGLIDDDADVKNVAKIPYQILVVDETSMMPTDLFARLLSACNDGTHVLFIGDTFQLPPIGHGAPLRDLIESGSVPVGELTEVRRNAGGIVNACVQIKQGLPFETNQIYLPEEGKNIILVETDTDEESVEKLDMLLANMRKFDPAWETQVIVSRNEKTKLSRKILNQLLKGRLNPNGKKVANNPFAIDDKVICLRNGFYKVVAIEEYLVHESDNAKAYSNVTKYNQFKEQYEPVEVFVANGEIGRVVAIAETQAIIQIESETAELVRVLIGRMRHADDNDEEENTNAAKGDGCDWTHGYAVTCHKMQGSETPLAVTLGDTQGGMVADRSWLYTAVSRARDLSILIGPRKVFDAMLSRAKLDRRKTFLRELLIESARLAEQTRKEKERASEPNSECSESPEDRPSEVVRGKIEGATSEGTTGEAAATAGEADEQDSSDPAGIAGRSFGTDSEGESTDTNLPRVVSASERREADSRLPNADRETSDEDLFAVEWTVSESRPG